MSTTTVPKKKKAKQQNAKRSLQAVIQPLLQAGGALSNIAFNLKQRKDLGPELTATLAEWQGKWDAARAAMHEFTEAQGLNEKIRSARDGAPGEGSAS